MKRITTTCLMVLPFYILYLIPAVLTGMIVWTIFVDGKLYYCSDKVPILDFIPPFVHGLQSGDYWIASPGFVWSIWILLASFIITVPFLLVRKKHNH